MANANVGHQNGLQTIRQAPNFRGWNPATGKYDEKHPDPDTWMDFFQNYIDANALTDEPALNYAKNFLRDDAHEWFRTLKDSVDPTPQETRAATHWPDFKLLFLKNFRAKQLRDSIKEAIATFKPIYQSSTMKISTYITKLETHGQIFVRGMVRTRSTPLLPTNDWYTAADAETRLRYKEFSEAVYEEATLDQRRHTAARMAMDHASGGAYGEKLRQTLSKYQARDDATWAGMKELMRSEEIRMEGDERASSQRNGQGNGGGQRNNGQNYGQNNNNHRNGSRNQIAAVDEGGDSEEDAGQPAPEQQVAAVGNKANGKKGRKANTVKGGQNANAKNQQQFPQNATQRTPVGRDFECTVCGRLGHHPDDCFMRQNVQRRKDNNQADRRKKTNAIYEHPKPEQHGDNSRPEGTEYGANIAWGGNTPGATNPINAQLRSGF